GRRPEPGRQVDGVVARARDLLHDDPLADVTADELARAAGSSRFALYRAFRRVYGMAPSDYQRQLRLRVARELLRAGTPPAEAAARAGFADQSHLHRWFVRCYGVTPGTYASGAQ
ncbi:AraC family transcriptional regulator, partial [Actinomadura logoneensis]